MSEKDLQFKPLSEGLGFHPFSNGLPYTPAAPKPVPKRDFSQAAPLAAPMGTGAVAAGRPNFVFPKASVTQALSPAAELAPATPPITQTLGWDYVGRRFFAYCVDSALLISLGTGILVASLWSSLEIFASADVLMTTAAFLLFFNWALIAAQEVAFGTSIGKKLFGLHLEGSAVGLLVRALVFIPGILFFGAGVLWCALDSDRRAFHDRVTGIQPEES